MTDGTYFPSVAYAYEDAKLAALWFDKVIPVTPSALNEREFRSRQDTPESKVLREILPTEIIKDEELFEEYLHQVFYNDDWGRWDNSESYMIGVEPAWATPHDAMLHASLCWSKAGVGEPSVCHFDEEAEHVSRGIHQKAAEPTTNVVLIAAKMPIVTSEQVPWEVILEFRKDAESIKKFRRFRLNAYSSYTGKPEGYIRDDLLRRMDDYLEVMQKWKFDTAMKGLKSLASFKSLPALISGIAANSMGAGTITSSIVAGSIALGEFSIEIYDGYTSTQKRLSQDPISYMVDIQKLNTHNK